MKAGRLPSFGITRSLWYYSPLRLLADLIRFSIALIPNHRGHHPQPARSPALPSKTSLTSRPDDPGKLICLFSVSSTDGGGLPLLTTGSALSYYQVTRLYGFLVSTACEFAILRVVSFLFLLSCRFGVFSIRLALRVVSQNRIFASRVYRKFPAPDFNRLVSPLPRRTVRLSYCVL
jgi:hypothetical protein